MKYRIFAFALCFLLLLTSCANDTVTFNIEDRTVFLSTENFSDGYYDISKKQVSAVEVLPMEETDVSDVKIFTENAILADGNIYITVMLSGIYDEYVYNINTGSGKYMSGVESLRKFDFYVHKNCPYYLNSIVSMNGDMSAAVMRKSKNSEYHSGKYLSGEYYIYDLKTGASEYICDSYPNLVDTVPGTRIECIEWSQIDRVSITMHDSDGEFCIYEAVRYDNGWTVSCMK